MNNGMDDPGSKRNKKTINITHMRLLLLVCKIKIAAGIIVGGLARGIIYIKMDRSNHLSYMHMYY